jgi:prevent-host-death family protein
MEVNIHEAKTHFSRLIQRVEAGEEVTISRAGKPVAKLIAAGPQHGTRPLGLDRGKMWMAPDFDAPDHELEALFYDAPITSKTSSQRKGKKRKR